jgi:hypothetical protein
MLLLHHKKPLLAYLFSVSIIILYMLIFKAPISHYHAGVQRNFAVIPKKSAVFIMFKRNTM